MADSVKTRAGVASAAAKLKNVQSNKLTLADVARYSETLKKEAQKMSQSIPSEISFVRKDIASGSKRFSFFSGGNWWKIGLYLLVITGAVISSLQFGWVGGLLAIVGIFFVYLVLKNPDVLGLVGNFFKNVFFLLIVCIIVFVLYAYLKVPPLPLFTLVFGLSLFALFSRQTRIVGIIILLLIFSVFFSGEEYLANSAYADSKITQDIVSVKQDIQSVAGTLPAKKIIDVATRSLQQTVAEVSGDAFTSSVDAGAKARLGVSMDELKTTQQIAVFLQGEPLTFYTTVKGLSLTSDIDVELACSVDDVIGSIKPDKKISFYAMNGEDGTSAEPSGSDVDCVIDAENSKKLVVGSHTLKLFGKFNFDTFAYLPLYFMDKDKQRELERKNLLKDWKASLPASAFTAITTQGPAKIGIGGGTQPVSISLRDSASPTVGISLTNVMDGHIKDIKRIILMVPVGLSVVDVNGIVDIAQRVSCSDLDVNEQKGCDDKIFNVYIIKPELVAPSGIISPYDLVTFRVHTKVDDYNKLVGIGATTVPKRVRALIDYDYEFSKEKTFSIRAQPTVAPLIPQV